MDSPLKWHGGKSYLASKIVGLFPDGCIHYVEPYFGGGAVLFAKPFEGWSEAVNDLNSELTNFWRVIRDEVRFHFFKRTVEAMPFSQPEFEAAAYVGPGHGAVQRAVAFFVRCRQSLAGRMDTFAPLSRNRTRRGMNEQASAWLSAVERLPEVHERLKRVVVLGPDDALKIIKSQDGPKSLFYLDPPYLADTRAAPEVYQHEMGAEQHEALLAALCRIKGKFLLSGYHSKLYDSYAAKQGWRCHAFEIPNHAAGGDNKRIMTECVWANFGG